MTLRAPAVLTAVVMFATSVFGQTPAPSALSIDVAQSIAMEAITKCRGDGYKVSVLVVDNLNAPKLLLRDDGAPATSTDVVKMKATAALVYNRASGPAPPVPGAAPAPPAKPGQFFFGNGMNAQGAVLIIVDGMTIGAVAVSGAPGGDKDAACASEGIARAAEKVK